MKKKIIGALMIIAFVVLPLSSHAQSTPVLTTEQQIVTLRIQLINLMQELIKLLQQQIEIQINSSTSSSVSTSTNSPASAVDQNDALVVEEIPAVEDQPATVSDPDIDLSLISKASGNLSGVINIISFRVVPFREDVLKENVIVNVDIDGPGVGDTQVNIPDVMRAGDYNRIDVIGGGFAPGSYTYSVGISLEDTDGNVAWLSDITGSFVAN